MDAIVILILIVWLCFIGWIIWYGVRRGRRKGYHMGPFGDSGSDDGGEGNGGG